MAEAPGQAYALVNSGTDTASLFETVLLPPGAALTTNAPSNLPTTGAANPVELAVWLLAVVGLAMLGMAWLLRRQQAH